MNQIRQGDVLFTRRKKTDKHDGKPERGRTVIVAGEATGHAHRIVSGDAIIYTDEAGIPVSIEVSTKTTVGHEEHGPAVLSPGQWDVTLQEEYDPETRSRRVVD